MDRVQTRGGELAESRALTGLRGIGAFLVMSHHLYLKVGLDQHLPMLQWGLRKGYLGVDLFFVLSGFVMSMVYGSWFAGPVQGSGRRYVRYMLRRVARLWPLHVTMLLVVIFSRWWRDLPLFTPRVLIENVFMVQAWGHSTEINPPAWSISTEFLIYLLFPLLVVLALRGVWRPVLCLVAVALALWACMHFAPPLGPMRRGRLDIYFNFSSLPELRCFSGFTMGMLAWRVGQTGVVQGIVSRPWVGPAALALMIGMMLGRVNDLLIFLVMPVVVLGMHFGRGMVHRGLSTSPLHELGVLSYAIYLVHFTVLLLFPFADYPMRFMLPAYVATTIGLAAVLHFAVERPGRRFIRALGERAIGMVWPRRATGVLERPLQDRVP